MNSGLYFVKISDAEALPATPEQPEELKAQDGEFLEDEEEDDICDKDYVPPSNSQGQQSGSSASFLNPSSQNTEVCVLIHLQLLLICRKFFLNLLTVYLLYYFYLQDSSGEPKVIVYVSLLLKLFTICQLEACGASIDPSNIETYRRGACLTVSRTCNNNHGFKVNMFVEYEIIFLLLNFSGPHPQ